MTIDYKKISELAMNVLEQLMNEKTGEELHEIFDCGEQAFDKLKAAAQIATKIVLRVTGIKDDSRAFDQLDPHLQRAIAEYKESQFQYK